MPHAHAPARRTPLAAGYIDNRPTLWIVLILAGIAVTQYASMRTGKGVLELFWSLPPPWPSFLLTVTGVVAVGVTVLFVGVRLWHGAPFRISTVTHGTRLRQQAPGQLFGGLLLAMLALTLVAFGLSGPGWWWGLVAVTGLLLLVVAASVLSRRVTWELAADTITRSERLFGSPRVQAWPVPARPSFTLDETTTGGAFGQPLESRYQVRLGENVLLETADAAQANGFIGALRSAYNTSTDPS
jgi:hypothetical protein